MKLPFLAASAALGCALAASPLLGQSSSLTRVQIIALQQQLRDDGCGVQHVTEHMDAPTRAAIKQCASKYNVSPNDPRALLTAMNIGFNPGDGTPSISAAKTGWSNSGMGGTLGTTPTTPMDSSHSMPMSPPVSPNTPNTH